MHIDKLIKREVINIVVTVVILLCLFIGVSYAAFFSVAEGTSNTISIGDIEVSFCVNASCGEDYSNFAKVIGLTEVDGVSVPNAIYPYENDYDALETTPYIFKVENTGSMRVYFNAYLEEDEDFIPKGSYSDYDSIIDLYSNYVKIGISDCTGGNINTENVTISTYGELKYNNIVKNEEVNVGESKTFCVWTWLSNDAPNVVQETYFVANLSFTAEYLPYTPWYNECDGENNRLSCKILENNVAFAESEASLNLSNINGINYSQSSSDSNGKGLYYTVDYTKTEDIDKNGKGERVYFFRGNVENNYLVFANYCWRIVRTNEDGSIKLRYSGIYDTKNNTCPQTGTVVEIANIPYSTNNSLDFKGLENAGIEFELNNWYSKNILNQGKEVTDLIANVKYCNDKSNYVIPSLGNFTNYTFMGAANRLLSTDSTEGILMFNLASHPQFKCEDNNDAFTLSVSSGGSYGYGNNKLVYPVALLTADEMNYAGLIYGENNISNYLYTGNPYWTMSPVGFTELNQVEYLVFTYGDYLNTSNITSSNGVVPVLSLKNEAVINKGSGLYNDPYIVDIN